MIYDKANATGPLDLYIMGRAFRIVAVADSDEDANRYMFNHPGTGVLTCFGDLVFLAHVHDEGVKA